METLHARIIDKLCRHDGWQRGNWKQAFRAKCKENDYWQSEIADAGMTELFGDFRRNPDAWRVVSEGSETPRDDPWNYDVLVLEFLEVEIGHPMPLDKRDDYVRLWWRFDSSDMFHFRVYRVERYGEPIIWLDNDSVYGEMFGVTF